MKRALPLLLTLSLLAGCAAGTGGLSPIPHPEGSLPPVGVAVCTSEGLGEAYDDYALKLLRACRQEGQNTLLSPLSISLALGMTANGASGDTRADFEALFGMSVDTLNSLSARFMEDYAALGGSTRATLANSLWADPDITLTDDFVLRCADPYSAQLYHGDLQDPATVNQVNQWVSDATQGLIPSVVKEFDRDAVLALVNGIYLKNAFLHPFAAPTSEWQMDFTAEDGTVSRPLGMHNGTRNEAYIAAEEGQGVLLPYDDGRLGLLLMLPREGLSLTDYLARWDGATIPALLAACQDTRVNLTMPKFKTEWSASLSTPLAALGLARAFDGQAADFSAMGTLKDPEDNLCIGDVIHKATFEVNEKGTEAAAVTAVIMNKATSMPADQPISLTLDRPFVYAIVDRLTGTPLFLGTLERCG